MLQKPGALAEVIMNPQEELQAIYYQDEKMRRFQQLYPELLVLDATYSLNDLRMPLYVLLVVDGNGESQPVGLWLVANKECETIAALMDIFVGENNAADIHCVMADEIMERQVAEKLPNAVLQIACGKMSITSQQRLAVLNLFSKMVYAKTEETYEEQYSTLKELGLPQVTRYIDSKWHGLKA
ncbi:hypothetical protein ACEWY4_015516 [Coilia grayii]|uniref:ZSWIM1/3 RNaseH-like domain-containing protein n=1 Tax=Coilia grayii TaxID=363190 RepID=A0ABD1JNE9_9TELE